MLNLFYVLAPIALIDSTSVIPLCIVPMTVLLGGKRPFAGTFAFLAGLFITYFPFGILITFGLDALLEPITGWLTELIHRPPQAPDMIAQLVIGLVLVVLGSRMAEKRKGRAEPSAEPDMTPRQAFGLGVALNLAGMWGAVPYFAAITEILRAEPGPLGSLAAVAWYNLVFLGPLLVFVLLRVILGDRAEKIFQAVARFFTMAGRKLILVLLIGLGFMLLVDAVVFFLRGEALIQL
jgi:hypothetical protein